MKESPSALLKWLDRDFFKLGAFLSSSDGEYVTFAKGGSFTVVEQFLETADPVFYLKDFYQNTYLAYIPANTFKIRRSEVSIPEVGHDHFSPISNDDDLYQKDFSLLQSVFGPELQKVVLVSREDYESFEGERTITHLIKKAFEFGTGIPYGFWDGQYGVIGSTPELLYDAKGGSLETFALAGTARLGEENKLLHSSKDRHEHDLVIHDIREKLEHFTDRTEVGQTGIHAYKAIVHLKTNITAQMPVATNYTDLTNSFSPTAALGGYPKSASLNFLKGSNYGIKYPKRYFGSTFGLITEESKTFIVSIRNVQWENKHLFIESGGGVVPESVFEKELDEIHLKRNTIRKHYL